MKTIVKTFLISIMVLSIHLPFISSDPDATNSFSRDANSDEGFYSYQIRNYIQTDCAYLSTTDAFFKTPLFQGIQYFGFKIFGQKAEIFRFFSILVFCATIVVMCIHFDVFFAVFYLVLSTLHPISFVYPHYSLPDAWCVQLIILSILLFHISIRNVDPKLLASSIIFLCISILSRLFYTYIAILIPLYVLLFWMIIKDKRSILKPLLIAFILICILLIACYLLLYQKHLDFVLWSFKHHNEQANINLSLETWYERLKYHGNQAENILYFSVLKICISLWLLTLFRQFIKKKFDLIQFIFIIPILIWLLIEVHKFTYTYLPNRYLYGYYVSLIFFTTFIIHTLFSSTYRNFIYTLILIFIVGFQSHIYWKFYQNRSFVQSDISKRLNSELKKGDVIAGNWSCSVAWGDHLITYPYSNDLLDTSEFWKLMPKVIFMEPDESESDHALKNKGVEISKIAKKRLTHKIQNWSVEEWWLNE